MKSGKCESDRGTPGTIGKLIRLPHLLLNIAGDIFIQLFFGIREGIIDGIGLSFRKERTIVEFDEFLFDHPAHDVGGIDLVSSPPEFSVKAI